MRSYPRWTKYYCRVFGHKWIETQQADRPECDRCGAGRILISVAIEDIPFDADISFGDHTGLYRHTRLTIFTAMVVVRARRRELRYVPLGTRVFVWSRW